MGDFCPIVLVLACLKDYGRENVPMCSWRTPKLAGLIDGSPQMEALTLDGDKDFIEVPYVAESSLFPMQSSAVGRSEFLTPIPNSLVRNNVASLSK